MKCDVNGKLIDKDRITYRDLGFNQRIPNKEILNYTITLNVDEFISVMEEPFNTFVRESREDDEITGNAETLGLLELGYPSFQQVLSSNKSFLEQFIKEYLFFEFLDGCLTERNKEKWNYAVNSIKILVIGNESVEVTGDIYEIG